MKTKALILVTFILTGYINECMPIDKEKAVNSETVKVIYTSDLRQMAEKWSEEFRSGESTFKPTLEAFNVQNTEKRSNALYLFTDKELKQSPFDKYWKMVVGRSIVVPVIHKQNALFADISKQGIQLDRLQELLMSPAGNTAEKTFNLTGNNNPVPVYHLPGKNLRQRQKLNAADKYSSIHYLRLSLFGTKEFNTAVNRPGYNYNAPGPNEDRN